MNIELGGIDLVIIGFYFIGVLTFGLWLAYKDRGAGEEDYFLAKRNLSWWIIGASLFASNISSEHLIGLSADGYRTGLAVGNYEWAAALVLIILAVLFVPYYIGTRITTMPEFLEKRFGLGSRLYLSIMTLTANILVRISVALYAGSLVLNQLFGIHFWGAVIILAFTTVLYTAAGGLKAVVYTDAVQTVILLIGTLALTWISLDMVGGWSSLRANLSPDMFDMVRPASDPEMPWPGLLFGVPILGIWYWCTDQVIVQRVLGAKNLAHARFGVIFAGYLKILPVFLFVLPGLCGRILFPEIDSKTIFPVMLAEILPVGLKGLVIAALIAALMSSLDSTLNSTGTLVSIDFFRRFRPNISSKQLVHIGRVTTVVVMIFGIAWVEVVARAESLFQYLQQVNAAISPPIASSFLIGVLWKRANESGILLSLIGGLLVGVGLLVWGDIPFLISAAVTFTVSVALAVAGSLWLPSRAQPVDAQSFPTVTEILADGTPMTATEKTLFWTLTSGLLALVIGLWATFF